MCKNLAELVKTTREEKMISREELARKINKSAQSIKDIEDGKTTLPQPETLRKIAKELELNTETLKKVIFIAKQQKSEPSFPLSKNSNSAKLSLIDLQNSKKNYLPEKNNEIIIPVIDDEEGEIVILNQNNEQIGTLTASLKNCKKIDFLVKFTGNTLRNFCVEDGMLIGVKAGISFTNEDLIAVKKNGYIDFIQFKNFTNEEIMGKVVVKMTDLREL